MISSWVQIWMISSWVQIWIWSVPGSRFDYDQFLGPDVNMIRSWVQIWIWSVPGSRFDYDQLLGPDLNMISSWVQIWIWSVTKPSYWFWYSTQSRLTELVVKLTSANRVRTPCPSWKPESWTEAIWLDVNAYLRLGVWGVPNNPYSRCKGHAMQHHLIVSI
jgi:hypothetical protein